MQEEAGVIKQYASDFQLFITFTKFENTVKNLEKDVQSLIKKDSAKKISISFSPNVELVIETLLPSLGNVNVITKESDIKLVNHSGKQAQISATGTPCVENIQLKAVLEKVPLPSGKDEKIIILDSCFLSHGRLAFSDKLNKRLIVLKDSGDHDRDINLSFMPNSIAYLTDNETAVGQSKSNEINIINMTSSSVDRSFIVKGYGMCSFFYREGQFFVTNPCVGFCITDIEGNLLSEIPYNLNMINTDVLFAVLLNNKIYYSQWKENRVVCCNLNGNNIYMIHEYKDSNLSAPLGVACTYKNFLFVTGFKSENIYVLASTVNELKELYCNSNLTRPRAISYNYSKKQLLVSTEGGKVFLFDVTY